ncbi:MAG: glutathione S-transferase [Rubrivivax sp.]
MQLIGMLDSPYVRRVAIALQLLDLRFTHRSLSVFRNFDAFSRINPMVKAPTLVCSDGTVLMDSTLILQYAESLAAPRRLSPAALPELQRDLQLTGLALAACEKCVQIVYEETLRPPEKQHAPWVERVQGQMSAGFAALEQALQRQPLSAEPGRLTQAALTVAVVWQFVQQARPARVPAAAHPALQALSDAAERLPAFRAAPHGDGVYPVAAAAGS